MSSYPVIKEDRNPPPFVPTATRVVEVPQYAMDISDVIFPIDIRKNIKNSNNSKISKLETFAKRYIKIIISSIFVLFCMVGVLLYMNFANKSNTNINIGEIDLSDLNVINGTDGLHGINGTDGLHGINRTDGLRGINGTDGQLGPGTQGEKGETGQQGPQGEQGETGQQGEQGETGQQGQQGEQGETGQLGPQGIQGEQGETGQQGQQGETGLQGQQGIQGPPGEVLVVPPNMDEYRTIPGLEELGRGFHLNSWTRTSSILQDTYNLHRTFTEPFTGVVYKIPDYVEDPIPVDYTDASAQTTISKSWNQYQQNEQSGIGLSVGLSGVCGIGGSSQHAEAHSTLSESGTYAFKTIKQVKTLEVVSKGNAGDYLNPHFVEDVNELPEWENNPTIMSTYTHFFAQWAPFVVTQGSWGGMINGRTFLSHARDYESEFSANNVAASVGVSLGPWSFGGSTSSSTASLSTNANFLSDMNTHISIYGGQAEGNTGSPSQVHTNSLNWGNAEMQEWIRDVKQNPTLIGFRVQKISTLFSDQNRIKLDAAINAIYGVMSHDLNEIHAETDRISTMVSDNIASTQEEISSIRADISNRPNTVRTTYSVAMVQSGNTRYYEAASTLIRRTCPPNQYMCGMSAQNIPSHPFTNGGGVNEIEMICCPF